MTELDVHKLDFGKWTRCVHGIERGIELKREGKTHNYDKWAHTIWMLKKIQ